MIELEVKNALLVDGQLLEGSLSSSQTLALTSGTLQLVDKIVVEDNYTMKTIITGETKAYQHLYIYSDKDVLVQKYSQGTDGGSALLGTYKVLANLLTSIPAISGNTGTLVSGTQTDEGLKIGSLSVLRVQNNVAEGVGDATVSVYLFY